MHMTASISPFVTETRFDRIPPQAAETAKIALLDSVGVALAGSRETSAKICAEQERIIEPMMRFIAVESPFV